MGDDRSEQVKVYQRGGKPEKAAEYSAMLPKEASE